MPRKSGITALKPREKALDLLHAIAPAATYAVMALVTGAALAVVTVRNLFHAALWLAVVLTGVAGIYISLHAEFLAMVQILIYVGAVMTLVVFAVMLTVDLTKPSQPQTNRQALPALFATVILGSFIAGIYLKSPWPLKETSMTAGISTARLGEVLMTQYVFPFEVIGILLFAVLIGALAVSRKDGSP